MRKKFLASVLGCMVVGAAAYNGYRSHAAYESNYTSDLLLANVEALAEENKNPEEFDYPTGMPFTSTCNVAISKWRRCKTTVITCQGGGVGCNEKKCPVHPA